MLFYVVVLTFSLYDPYQTTFLSIPFSSLFLFIFSSYHISPTAYDGKLDPMDSGGRQRHVRLTKHPLLNFVLSHVHKTGVYRCCMCTRGLRREWLMYKHVCFYYKQSLPSV